MPGRANFGHIPGLFLQQNRQEFLRGQNAFNQTVGALLALGGQLARDKRQGRSLEQQELDRASRERFDKPVDPSVLDQILGRNQPLDPTAIDFSKIGQPLPQPPAGAAPPIEAAPLSSQVRPGMRMPSQRDIMDSRKLAEQSRRNQVIEQRNTLDRQIERRAHIETRGDRIRTAIAQQGGVPTPGQTRELQRIGAELDAIGGGFGPRIPADPGTKRKAAIEAATKDKPTETGKAQPAPGPRPFGAPVGPVAESLSQPPAAIQNDRPSGLPAQSPKAVKAAAAKVLSDLDVHRDDAVPKQARGRLARFLRTRAQDLASQGGTTADLMKEMENTLADDKKLAQIFQGDEEMERRVDGKRQLFLRSAGAEVATPYVLTRDNKWIVDMRTGKRLPNSVAAQKNLAQQLEPVAGGEFMVRDLDPVAARASLLRMDPLLDPAVWRRIVNGIAASEGLK